MVLDQTVRRLNIHQRRPRKDRSTVAWSSAASSARPISASAVTAVPAPRARLGLTPPSQAIWSIVAPTDRVRSPVNHATCVAKSRRRVSR